MTRREIRDGNGSTVTGTRLNNCERRRRELVASLVCLSLHSRCSGCGAFNRASARSAKKCVPSRKEKARGNDHASDLNGILLGNHRFWNQSFPPARSFISTFHRVSPSPQFHVFFLLSWNFRISEPSQCRDNNLGRIILCDTKIIFSLKNRGSAEMNERLIEFLRWTSTASGYRYLFPSEISNDYLHSNRDKGVLRLISWLGPLRIWTYPKPFCSNNVKKATPTNTIDGTVKNLTKFNEK